MAFNNSNQRLDGLNPLAYMGVNASQPSQFVIDSRAPTINDADNFQLGAVWLNRGINYSIAPTNSDIWMLVALINGNATWVNFGNGGTSVLSLSGNTGTNPVFPIAGNIKVFGDGVTIDISGDGVNTLTASTTGLVALEYDTDDGNFAIAVNGILDVAGSLNISTASNPVPGNLLAISVSGTTNHEVQIGNATGSLTSVPNGTTGQVLTAQTGADPIWSSPTTGALVLIQTQTAAGVATLSFTTGITTTYNNYLMIIDSVNCPTASTDGMFIQLSTNGGSTWISTGYLAGSATPIGLSTGGPTVNLPTGTTHLSAATTITNATSGSGYIITCGTNTYYDTGTGQTVGVNNANGAYTVIATVANAFRIIVDGTKVFSGNFSLYGYVK